MNVKKILFTAAALLFIGNTLAQAQDVLFLTPDEVKAKLKNNLPLPTIYLGAFGNRKTKDELCQLAKQQANKYHNYVAYANAAIVYTADSEHGLIPHDITKQDMMAAREYATRALALRPKSVNMYVLRGLAIERFLNIDLLAQNSIYEDRVSPAIRKNEQLSLELIKDYEKALQLDSNLPLYAVLQSFYQALGFTEKAKYCQQYLENQNALYLKKTERQIKYELNKKLNS